MPMNSNTTTAPAGDDLQLSDAAIPYILFQRTAYLRLPHTFLYRVANKLIGDKFPLYHRVVDLEARRDPKRIRQLYSADMRQELASFQSHLPEECASWLDIGCGIAGIDVLLHRHYQAQQQTPEIYLLDKSRVEDEVFYMYKAKGAFYNSLEEAKSTLVANGVEAARVHLLEANDRNEIPTDGPLDLILSLISWGFHYPVSVYLDPVHRLLSERGVLILDVRKETDGLDLLRERFGSVEIITEAERHLRVAARK